MKYRTYFCAYFHKKHYPKGVYSQLAKGYLHYGNNRSKLGLIKNVKNIFFDLLNVLA